MQVAAVGHGGWSVYDVGPTRKPPAFITGGLFTIGEMFFSTLETEPDFCKGAAEFEIRLYILCRDFESFGPVAAGNKEHRYRVDFEPGDVIDITIGAVGYAPHFGL